MKLPVEGFSRGWVVKRQQHQQRIVIVAAIPIAGPTHMNLVLITNLSPHQTNLVHMLIRGPKIRAEL